jgi:hypothetical protein
LPDDSEKPLAHPEIARVFDGKRNGLYVLRDRRPN